MEGGPLAISVTLAPLVSPVGNPLSSGSFFKLFLGKGVWREQPGRIQDALGSQALSGWPAVHPVGAC